MLSTIGTALMLFGGAYAAPLGAEGVTLTRLVEDLDADGRKELVEVVRTRAGNVEVLLLDGRRATRMVGFEFGPADRIHLRAQDVSFDGVRDLQLSNFRAHAPDGTASPGGPADPATAGLGPEVPAHPVVYTLVTPPEGFGRLVWAGGQGSTPPPAPVGASIRVRTSTVSDADNFGFGVGFGTPICNYFENGEPEDLGIFDREHPNSFEIDQWSHVFGQAGYPLQVVLETWEIYSDPTPQSTIALDGVLLNYATSNWTTCASLVPGGLRRVQVLSRSDALIAWDGRVDVVFDEFGDDIAMDRAILSVMFFLGELPSTPTNYSYY